MQFSVLVASLGLLSAITASPAADISERAASGKVALKILGTGHRNLYASVLDNGKKRRVLVGTAPHGSEFTVSGGSLHSKIKNAGQFSTNALTYGDFVHLDQGKGSDDYLIINKTDGLLTFKPTQSGTPGETGFRFCWLSKPQGSATTVQAISLGDAGPVQKKCQKITIKAIPL